MVIRGDNTMAFYTYLFKIGKYCINKSYRFRISAYLGLFNFMSDIKYLKKLFYYTIGKELDLETPKTFNEKLQWLKLYDRNPEYTTMVDKYAVKEYVAEKIGDRYVIPTLGIWDRFDDIDFTKLPNQFVLKCTHDSGGIIICKDKKEFNEGIARKKLNKLLKRNYFYYGREWPYKNVKPRIIAEKYMTDESGTEPDDYKVHNFNGVPKVILVCRDRFKDSGMTEDFYSDSWEHLDVCRSAHPNAKEESPRPAELEEMLQIARTLSKDIPFVRTDFYTINHKVYFGELTFYPASGFEPFIPQEYDSLFGEWINLQGREFDQKR